VIEGSPRYNLVMERKITFAPGEYYHVYSRGVEKRKIFQSQKDYQRFLAILYILNQKKSFVMSNYLRNKNIKDIFSEPRDKSIVSILSYALMPNHFHLLIKEENEKGISKFMGKLLTAYSMYFNTKYERSGPLFTRPFRAVHVKSDFHLKHLFSYIHLNCLELTEYKWKENGISNYKSAGKFIKEYPYSSYQEYLNKNHHKIVDQKALGDTISRAPLDIREYERWYLDYESE
jgi:putative transposase